MLKSTMALTLAVILIACGGGNEPVQTSGPQTLQPPITKGAPTDTPVAPETGDESIAAEKKSLV